MGWVVEKSDDFTMEKILILYWIFTIKIIDFYWNIQNENLSKPVRTCNYFSYDCKTKMAKVAVINFYFIRDSKTKKINKQNIHDNVMFIKKTFENK